MKNRMREIRTSGSVRDGDGDIPVYSAEGGGDRPADAGRVVKPAVACIGIRLQHARPAAEMTLRMLGSSVR